jgi:outer membrane receptor protein involved in Fe transport
MQNLRTPWAALGVAACVACVSTVAHAQDAGTLRGFVTDRDFGGPVAGATVTIVETGAKASTGEDGSFSLSLPAGKYTAIISKDGFVRQVRSEVIVNQSQLSSLNLELAGEYEDMDEFIVQELELGGSEASLLTLRLDSPQLLDSVGADIISKAGASDAAAALLLVPGASVQEGRYAVVRGLPDRYVAALLDGVRLPTSDAERRAVQLDQFPSAVIQSLQVSKTFTPDQQGDSSGGAINIDLKDLPDQPFFQLKGQLGTNSQVQGAGDKFLTYQGADIPVWGGNAGRNIPTDLIGQSWPNATGTEETSNPAIDYKWSAAGGGSWEVDDGIKVGAFASFFYETDSSYFDNGIEDSWVIDPQLGTIPEPSLGDPTQVTSNPNFQSSLLDITQGSQSIQWGGLASVGVETERNKLGLTYFYSRTATSTATLAENTRGKQYWCTEDYEDYWSTIIGYPIDLPAEYDPNDPASAANNELLQASPYQRLETLTYTETSVESTILKGEHKLGSEDGELFKVPILDWTASASTATWDQPDKTQFASVWWPPSNAIDPSLPGIWIPLVPAENANLGWVQHIWQSVEETSNQLAANLKLPFLMENDREGYFKTGMFLDKVERTFTQETFSNNQLTDPNPFYVGGWDQPWSEVFAEEDHPIYESTYDIDYDGQQNIGAFYMMADLPLGEEWNLVGGFRLESTSLSTEVFGDVDALYLIPGIDPATGQPYNLVPFSADPTGANADYRETSVLPSIGGEWKATETVTVRLSYAQTVARQTFREITPVLQQEYLGGPIFIGNPLLTMASLDNYDVRLDYTPVEGLFLSGSIFYKELTDTIEYSQFDSPQGFVYTSAVNYPEGTLIGGELEGRLKANLLNENLEGLSFGLNATIINSQVTLPEDEQTFFATNGFPLVSRDMTGAPAYLFNANAVYEFEPTGTQLALFYTITGDTLETGAGIDEGAYIPSVYSKSYGTLNFTLQQYLTEHLKLFFQAKNLTNPEIQTVYRSPYLAEDILNTSYTAGVDFSIGLSFQMDF